MTKLEEAPPRERRFVSQGLLITITVLAWVLGIAAGIPIGASIQGQDWIEWCHGQGGYVWSPGSTPGSSAVNAEGPVEPGDVYYCLRPDEDGNAILGTKEMS
jgi:hypothetical protein